MGKKSIRIVDPLSEHPLGFDPVIDDPTLVEDE
jgi:hypothetical protein